jgi:WS/DGAT/MGAT family acyltransferase
MADETFEHAMGDADALMWHVERDPHLRSPIVVLLVLDRAPSWKRVLERLDRGTRLIPRMRQRVVEPAVRVGPPAWSADPDFDLSYHARRVRLPKGSKMRAALDIAERAAMGDFDRARPLWEYTLIEGLPKGRAAFVLKVHHSMTDGVGGMRLLMMLFDLERTPGPDAPEPEPIPLPVFSPIGLVGNGIAWQARRAVDSSQRLADTARSALQRVKDDPVGALDQVTSAAGSIARFLSPAFEPCSPLLEGRSLDRRVGILRFPLDELKRAASAAGGTVNDAFVAGVLGGLQRYHARHESDASALRMIMPINVRGAHPGLGGNHFTPARLVVPLTIDDPAERVQVVGEKCRELRAEPAVALSPSLAGVLNHLPRRAATFLFGSMLKGADFVTSNVPGSPFPLYLCGSRVDALYAFAPLSGSAANITLLTHCGVCCVGINSDPRAIPDTKRFQKDIRRGLDEVLALSAAVPAT